MVVALDTAERFARALDHEDYLTALDCLSADCVYEFRGETIHGAAAVIESYRANGAWAAQHFDEIWYESSVRSLDDATAVVTFVDHIVHATRALTHRCEQWIDLDGGGRIVRITHVDAPGECESLQRFLDEIGLRK
jgi:hypothetical protein